MNKIRVYLDWLRKDSVKQLKKAVPNYAIIRLSFLSLFYNEHLTQAYAIDTLLEPMFWFVDNFTDTLGPIFVFLVCIMMFHYVMIAYVVGLPFWICKSLPVTITALIAGNYLMINALFHYFMAWKTNPGGLPSDVFIKNSVSICKKCILPKPVRCHHCSVCDKCILKMDHHCPWLNNCIGHFNHRYFFMFCLFAWLGTIFVIVFGLPLALNHYFSIDIYDRHFHVSTLFDLNNYLNASTQLDPSVVAMDQYLQAEFFDALKVNYQNLKNNCIIFELLLTVSAFVAIGGLMLWHARIITSGETCIESLRNKKERSRLKGTGVRFVNPFDKGWRNNWKRFFGLDQSGISLRHVLLPSVHKPLGDGIEWEMFFD